MDCKEYYDFGDKLLKSEVVFKDGIENGAFAYYDPKGNLESKGDYQRVMPDGHFPKVLYDGKIVFNKRSYDRIWRPWRIETWKDFKKSGLFTTFSYKYHKETGVTYYGYTKYNYVDNLRSGIQEVFDGENIKTSEEYYEIVEINGRSISQKTGMHKKWIKGQLTSLTNWQNGMRNGVSKQYYDNGQLAAENNYKDDRLINTSKEFHKNGNLKKITSVETNENRDRITAIKDYFDNGQLARDFTQIQDTLTNHSKNIGWYTTYEANGNLMRKFYSSNKGDVKVDYHFKNGQLDNLNVKRMLKMKFYLNKEIQSVQLGDISYEITSDKKLNKVTFNSGKFKNIGVNFDEEGEITEIKGYSNNDFRKIRDKQVKEIAIVLGAQYNSHWNSERLSTFDIQDGQYEWFYADGAPFFKIEFKDNLPQGSWITYNPILRDTITCAEYDNGKPVGKWIDKDFSGATISEITYFNNHQVKSELRKSPKGKTMYFRTYNSLGNYVLQTRYHTNDQLASSKNYKTNNYIRFRENGDTISYRKTSSINDSISIERIFYENNRIKSNSIYNYDTETRNYSIFYKNGNIRSVANTKYPQRSSDYKKYNKRGKLILEGKSKEGKRDGKWIKYGVFGIKKVTNYHFGKIVD